VLKRFVGGWDRVCFSYGIQTGMGERREGETDGRERETRWEREVVFPFGWDTDGRDGRERERRRERERERESLLFFLLVLLDCLS